MDAKELVSIKSAMLARAKMIVAHYDHLLPTASDYTEALVKLANPEDRCNHCSSTAIVRQYGARNCKCGGCKMTSWSTSGTFYADVRNARAWFLATMIFQDGIILSCSELARLLKIPNSTGQEMYHKFAMRTERMLLADAIVRPSADYVRVIFKRSKETPARQPPYAEQQVMESEFDGADQRDGNADFLICDSADSRNADNLSLGKESSVPDDFDVLRDVTVSCDSDVAEDNMLRDEVRGGELSEPAIEDEAKTDEFFARKALVYNALKHEPIHFDVLCEETGLSARELAPVLTILSLDEAVVPLPGDRYARTSRALKAITRTPSRTHDKASDQIFEDSVSFIRIWFHGVSRKYLQHYLTSFWCFMKRNEWCPVAFLHNCLQGGPINLADIYAYLTPLNVGIAQSNGHGA